MGSKWKHTGFTWWALAHFSVLLYCTVLVPLLCLMCFSVCNEVKFTQSNKSRVNQRSTEWLNLIWKSKFREKQVLCIQISLKCLWNVSRWPQKCFTLLWNSLCRGLSLLHLWNNLLRDIFLFFRKLNTFKSMIKATVWKRSSRVVLNVSFRAHYAPLSWPLLLAFFQHSHSYAPCISSRYSMILLSPLCSSLSHLHLPHCPSIHLTIQILRGGRALRLCVRTAFLRAVQWNVLWIRFRTALGAICQFFSVCVRVCDQEMHSLWSSVTLLYSWAKKSRCSTLRSDRGRGTPEKGCSSALHFYINPPSFSFFGFFVLLTLCCCLRRNETA